MHVVFGTGPIGLAVIDHLVDLGIEVRAVNRSGVASVPSGVPVLGGDASNPGFAASAARGATVVYQCLNPRYDRWPELFPSLQRSVISAAATAGAKLVSLENLYMYGHDPSRPITEDRPEAPHTRKGQLRKAMSDELRQAHADGRVRVAIGRASNYFGPRGGPLSTLGDRVVPRILAGKGVSVLGDPDLPHTHCYLPDMGRDLVTLGRHDEALGQVWLLSHPETVSTRELVKLMYDAAGTTGSVRKVPRPALRVVSLINPLVRETMEMLYEYDEPHSVASAKFTDAFGVTATPLAEAAATTVGWYRQYGNRAPAGDRASSASDERARP